MITTRQLSARATYQATLFTSHERPKGHQGINTNRTSTYVFENRSLRLAALKIFREINFEV